MTNDHRAALEAAVRRAASYLDNLDASPPPLATACSHATVCVPSHTNPG